MFSHSIRVYWEDTDAGGVVFHARYLSFLERTRTEWLRARGVELLDAREREDLVMAVRSLQVEYEAPARLDDLLQSRLSLQERRGASFSLSQELWRGTSVCCVPGFGLPACTPAPCDRGRCRPGWSPPLKHP